MSYYCVLGLIHPVLKYGSIGECTDVASYIGGLRIQIIILGGGE